MLIKPRLELIAVKKLWDLIGVEQKEHEVWYYYTSDYYKGTVFFPFCNVYRSKTPGKVWLLDHMDNGIMQSGWELALILRELEGVRITEEKNIKDTAWDRLLKPVITDGI